MPRLLSALASTATVLVLFRLVRLLIDVRTALWAALLYAFLPLTVYYGRTIQPESFMLLFSCLGLYAIARWSLRDSPWWLLLGWAAITLTCLLKITSLYLGLPIAFLCWRRDGLRMILRPELWIFAAALFGAVLSWYMHANKLGQSTGLSFGILHDPKHAPWAQLADPQFYNIIILRRLAERHFTWAGFVLLLVGLCLPRRVAGERFFDIWLIAVIVYIGIAAFNNRIHEYYQLPFMLPGVVYPAKVLSRCWTGSLRCVLGAAVAAVVAFSAYRIAEYARLERPQASAEIEAAQAAQSLTTRDQLIIAVDAQLPTNPTLLYIADRKGWTPRLEDLTLKHIGELRARGAIAIIGTKRPLRPQQRQQVDLWLDRVGTRYTIAHSTDDAFVVLLR